MKSIKINNMPDLPYAMEEAVNRLRINISFLGTKIKKIMIISTEPNEGKSFVAMQLWMRICVSRLWLINTKLYLKKRKR